MGFVPTQALRARDLLLAITAYLDNVGTDVSTDREVADLINEAGTGGVDDIPGGPITPEEVWAAYALLSVTGYPNCIGSIKRNCLREVIYKLKEGAGETAALMRGTDGPQG